MDSLNLYSDDELVERLKQDDSLAFELIYRRYVSNLYQAAFNILKEPEVCEDIIQELFINLWSKRKSLHILNLKPYLYRATRNNVLMAIRSNRIQVDLNELEKLTSCYTSDKDLMENQLQGILYESLEQLPTKCRVIFQMSRFEHLSHKEIAAQLNISVKTVENQIGIALKRLKILLSEFIYLIVFFLY